MVIEGASDARFFEDLNPSWLFFVKIHFNFLLRVNLVLCSNTTHLCNDILQVLHLELRVVIHLLGARLGESFESD